MKTKGLTDELRGRPTGLTVKELPLAGFPRIAMEGSVEQIRTTLEVAETAVRTGDTTGLKPGVDPITLLIESAKMLGQGEFLLQLDDEALERERKV